MMTTRIGLPRRALAALSVTALAAGVVVATALTAAADGPTTYSNTTYIDIPTIGSASPYPSPIAVSGMAGTVSYVAVTLNGFTHSYSNDVDVMLVAPGGSSLMVMSDAGGLTPSPASNATLFFTDEGAGAVPSGTIVSGTFKPTNYTTPLPDDFPAPAPAPSSATTFADAFNGISPNGTWQLYVVDNAAGDAGSIAGGWSLTVATTIGTPTTTVVTSSLNPSTVGDSVTFTAAVTAGGSPVTSGTVSFADGGSNIGAPVAVSASGIATFTTASMSPGSHSITATYNGDATHAASVGSLSQTVNLAATTTSLVPSANPSDAGTAVTFTATVTSGGAPVAEGTVQFWDGATALGGPVTLSGAGTATFTTSALTQGSHLITASYTGTSTFATSTASLTQVVQQSATDTALTASPNPSFVGDVVTIVATVTSGGTPVTEGGVTFLDDGAPLGGVVSVDASGQATLSTSALAAGTHPITAMYEGTLVYAASTNIVSQVVISRDADAGGPYTVAEGGSLTLAGSSTDPGATFAWDINGDGDYSDASGASPTLTWAQLEALGISDGPVSLTVGLRVTASDLSTLDRTATLAVTNTAPVTVITGELKATAGVPFTIKVGAEDPSRADMAAMFTYVIDWGDGSPVVTVVGPADPPVTHTYSAAGDYQALLYAVDKDGGAGESLSITVAAAAGDLSGTGTDPRGPLTAAAALLAAGAVLVRRFTRAR